MYSLRFLTLETLGESYLLKIRFGELMSSIDLESSFNLMTSESERR